jgi:hypothetical protein
LEGKNENVPPEDPLAKALREFLSLGAFPRIPLSNKEGIRIYWRFIFLISLGAGASIKEGKIT